MTRRNDIPFVNFSRTALLKEVLTTRFLRRKNSVAPKTLSAFRDVVQGFI